MKVFLGILGGFAMGAWLENKARKKMDDSGENQVKGLEQATTAYKLGWIEGKNWVNWYHKVQHPDCNVCPH